MTSSNEEHGTDNTTPANSRERIEDIKEVLSVLDEQEKNAKGELARIQEKKRILTKELLENEFIEPDDLELTPAMVDETITILRAEFYKDPDDRKKAGYRVQEGIDFSAVEKKLRAKENREKLKAVYRMVQEGSCPAVVCEEDGMFCIAETFDQTLPRRANCVYDREAEIQVGEEKCNGNAVDQARKRGIPLMERRIARDHIIAFPDKKQHCFDYIQATTEERERGKAPYVNRNYGRTYVVIYDANHQSDHRGWRGAVWV